MKYAVQKWFVDQNGEAMNTINSYVRNDNKYNPELMYFIFT